MCDAAGMVHTTCERCGQSIMSIHEVKVCSSCEAEERWAALPDTVRQSIDAQIRDRLFLQAMMTLTAHDPRCGLADADATIALRAKHIAVPRVLPDPDLETVVARAAVHRIPIAIEAFWDGDTVHDWFTVLAIVVDEEGTTARHDLTTLHGSPGVSHAQRARAYGDALAARFGIPFHFPSEAKPDDRAPRWSDALVRS